MFPKKGNNFPVRRGKPTLRYSAAISAALSQELGTSHQAIKTLMKWTGANERTVKNWIAGTTGPSGTHLIGIIRHSNAALDTILLLAGRDRVAAAQRLLEAREILADMVSEIDAWIEHGHRARSH